jgi:hypothetical protein
MISKMRVIVTYANYLTGNAHAYRIGKPAEHVDGLSELLFPCSPIPRKRIGDTRQRKAHNITHKTKGK